MRTLIHPETRKTFIVGSRKRPAAEKLLRSLHMNRYMVGVPLPTPPARTYYSRAATPSLSNILGNDVEGDCTIAACGHLEGVFTANAGRPIFIPTLDQVNEMYSRCQGPPGFPAIDNGCDEITVLDDYKTNGLAGHKCQNWMRVDATNVRQCQIALWLFENLYLTLELPDAYVNPFPSSNGFVWNVAGESDPRNGHCFTGDTRVSLLDGRELSFEELLAGSAGDSFWVYSCDEAGNVVPGHAHSVRKTREYSPIVKVTLDNGEAIRCTPDHLFLMRDGSYKQANELHNEDSLMPLYRRDNDYGYEQFLNPRTEGWHTTFHVVAFGVGGGNRGLVAHHVDFNKRNNSPENLQPMTKTAHRKLHEETGRILNAYATSERGREKSRELMSALWADPAWREKIMTGHLERSSNGGKILSAMGGGFKGIEKERLREICRSNGKRSVVFMDTPDSHEKSTRSRSVRFANDPEYREQVRSRAIANIRKAHSLPLTEKQREARRNNMALLHNKRWGTPINHKVTSVEVAGYEDVYDLTVDEHHNFALSSGVFVHNCIVAVDYNFSVPKYPKFHIATWGMEGYMTPGAMMKYCTPRADSFGGGCYTVLSAESINRAKGRAPNGLNFAELEADFAAGF